MKSLLAGMMLLAAATVPVFPFVNYADVSITEFTIPSGVCGLADGTALQTVDYTILSTTLRDVFMHIGKDGDYDYVYLTAGRSGGKIEVRRSLTIAQARAEMPTGPCEWLRALNEA